MARQRLGAYAKLSATFYRDDAILRAGEAAETLYVRGLAFCAESVSDGFITELQVEHVIGVRLKALAQRVEALVREGLWEPVDGGYVVRGWLKWNKSAEDIGMTRKRDRERKSSGRNPSGIHLESVRSPSGFQTNGATHAAGFPV